MKPAIDQMSGHRQDQTMFFRVAEADDGGCPWRTSEEDHWVANFSSCLLDRSRNYRPNLQFHQLFEKPSHGSEAKEQGGYDLSCGPYDNETFRIRSMHKVIKGKWCDAYWGWTADADDMRHVQALIDTGFCAAYLIINVFYCLHDWRRMGQVSLGQDKRMHGFIVPEFASPIRTVVVDLSASRKVLNRDGVLIRLTCSGLRKPVATIHDWLKATTDESFLTAVADDVPLVIVPLENLLKQLDSAWEAGGAWEQSELP